MAKSQIREVPVPKKNALLKFALAMQVSLLKRNWMGSKMGSMVMVLRHKGRKTGTDFATPVAYLRDDEDLLCLTNGVIPSNWSLNALAAGEVELNIQGADTRMEIRKLEEPAEIAAAFEHYHTHYGMFERAFFCDRDAPQELLHQARDRMTFLRLSPLRTRAILANAPDISTTETAAETPTARA